MRSLSHAVIVAAALCAGPAFAADSKLSKDAVNNAPFSVSDSRSAAQPQIIAAEVLLDRAHASPGVIDGKSGANFKKAIAAYAETHSLPARSSLDKQLWDALKQDGAPALVDYTISETDVAGPFIGEVPTDYAEMAKLKALGYVDATQALSAKFHMDESLLKELNPEADFGKAGTTIVVANVETTPIKEPIARIDVEKDAGQIRALDADGKLVVAYPATIGSEETPSPSGSYEVRAIARNPDYTYNPDKNFKQGDNDKPLRIAPGPNNPVGTVFIALTKPTYGIHGTPDPTKIDKVGSHGCVRLTNWDAEQLSHAVKKGIPVRFVD